MELPDAYEPHERLLHHAFPTSLDYYSTPLCAVIHRTIFYPAHPRPSLSPSPSHRTITIITPARSKMPPSPPGPDPATLLSTLLSVVERQIVPLTAAGVAAGDKVFGAAILAKADLVTRAVATNHERASPLLHGEIHCIQQFFAAPAAGRPATRDCVFIATHEPCSLCLSGITVSGPPGGGQKGQGPFNM